MADGAPLLVPADRSTAALSKGGGGRDDTQEKGSEKRGGGVKSQKLAADKQKAKVRNGYRWENKEKSGIVMREEAKVRSASEMRGLRAYLALETPNFPVKPSQPRRTATEGESRVPR